MSMTMHFQQLLTAEQEDWLKGQIDKHGLQAVNVPPRAKGSKENPCLAVYGPGPEGKRCKDCARLFAHWTARKFNKCELRNFTHGPGSDHLVSWPACGKFMQKEEKKS